MITMQKIRIVYIHIFRFQLVPFKLTSNFLSFCNPNEIYILFYTKNIHIKL